MSSLPSCLRLSDKFNNVLVENPIVEIITSIYWSSTSLQFDNKSKLKLNWSMWLSSSQPCQQGDNWVLTLTDQYCWAMATILLVREDFYLPFTFCGLKFKALQYKVDEFPNMKKTAFLTVWLSDIKHLFTVYISTQKSDIDCAFAVVKL